MRIGLIDPPGISKGLNVGLAILASRLQRAGCDVAIFDLNNASTAYRQRIKQAAAYDVVGISVKSFTVDNARTVADALSRNDLICGGPHITLDGLNFLHDNPNFKIGVSGEAEESFIEVIRDLENGKSLSEVKGIVYRGGTEQNEVISTGSRQMIEDLDALPFPDYRSFDSVAGQITDYPLLTSRGCPFSCIYCCVGKVSGKKIRFRGLDNVLAELEGAKAAYRATDFHILDDNFTSNIQRAKDFCRLLIKNRIGMRWSCPNGIRADCLDEELVSLMRSSGLQHVSIGIESLDKEVFCNIKKGEQLEDITKAIAVFRKYRVRVNGFFMIGLPRDTYTKSLGSIRESAKLGLHTALWNLFVPYPGTEAADTIAKEAKLIRDWKQGFHFGPRPRVTFETPEFSQEQRVEIYRRANIRSRNYSAFWDKDASVIRNLLVLAAIILRYDAGHIAGHIYYFVTNLAAAGKYFRRQTRG